MYLAKLLGRFATLGMAEDTWALNEGVIDEQAFLEQTWLTHSEREAMFLNALDRTRRGVVACVFDATDRVQHMFYHHGSTGVIEDLYRRADELVGKTLPHVDDARSCSYSPITASPPSAAASTSTPGSIGTAISRCMRMLFPAARTSKASIGAAPKPTRSDSADFIST